MKRTIVLASLLLCASFTASARSISVCFGDTQLQAQDDLVGLEAVPARNWMNVSAFGNTGTIPTTSVTTTFKDDRGVSLSGMNLYACSRGGNYQNGYTISQAERLIYSYLDDSNGTAAGFKVTGIPYSSYKVIVYRGTDIANTNPFGPHTINGTVYTYTNGALTAGLSQGWGYANKSRLVEGDNTMVVGPLSGDLTVLTTRLSATCRACISGFQIVDLGSSDYQATVSADSNWSALTWAPTVADWNALAPGASALLSATADSTVTIDTAMNLYRAVAGGPACLTLTNATGITPVIPFLNITNGSVTVKAGTLFSNVVAGIGTTNYFHGSSFKYISGEGSARINGGNYDCPANYEIFTDFGATGSGSATFYSSTANAKRPCANFSGNGMLKLQFGISDTTPLGSMIDMNAFTGTLRINNTVYKCRINQGAVMSTASSMPSGATLLLSTNIQLFCTSAFTCNADVEFEPGADPVHTFLDSLGNIGQLRLNAAATFNGAIRIGTGTVRVGTDGNGVNYLFNGPISGNILELGAVGYGNNCVYKLNGDNSHALTRVMDNGRNVLVQVNTATALGQNLSFVTNSTGSSVITLSNGLNVAVQTLFGTNANSTIAFASTNSQLSITGSGNSLYTGQFSGGGKLSKSGTGLFDLQTSAATPCAFASLSVSEGTLVLSNATARTFTVGALALTGGTTVLRGSQRLVGTSFTGGAASLAVDVAGLKPGTYPVVVVPGNTFTSGDFSAVTCVNTNALLTYSVVYASGSVSIVIGGLAWNGGADGTWDTINTDWLSGGSGAIYADGNNVLFGDIVDTAQATNTLDAVLYPASVTFDSTNTTWTLKTNPGETGTITNGDFIVTSGTVILADTNVLRSFTGTIKIYGGTLDATLSNSIPTNCTIQLMAPGTLRTSTYFSTTQLPGFGGDLVFSGTSTNAWGAISTVGGARLIVESGILKGTHNDSFGSRTSDNSVTVKTGGAIDINGISRNTRLMTLTIAGTGWTNSGAIFNSSATAPNNNSGIRNLLLAADATAAVPSGRVDFGNENTGSYIDFNGFTLTKTGTADSYFRFDEIRDPGPFILDKGFVGFCGFQIGDTTNMPITVQPGATLGNYLAGNIYSPLTFNSLIGGAVTNYANWRAYDNTAANNITWRGPVTFNPTAKITSYTVNIGDVSQLQPGGYLTLGYAVLRLPAGTPSFGYPLYTDAGANPGFIEVGTNSVELTSAVTGASDFGIRGTGTAKWNGNAAGLTAGLLLENTGCTLQLMKDFNGPLIKMNAGTVLMSDSASARAVPGSTAATGTGAVTIGDVLNNGVLTIGQINAIGAFSPTYAVNSQVRATKLTFGGYGATFNVATDITLTLDEVNSAVNNGVNLQKSGLGRMRINNATGGTPKPIIVNAGTLEFNNTNGVAYAYAGTITAAIGTTLEKTGNDLISFTGGTTSLDTLIAPAQETSGLAITSASFSCNRIQLNNGGTLDTSKSYILLNGGTLRTCLPLTVAAPESWYAGIGGANLTLTYRVGRPYTLTWNGGTGNWSTSLASTDWLNGVTPTYFANNDGVRLTNQTGVPNATLTVVNDVTTSAIAVDAPQTAYTLQGASSLQAQNVLIAPGSTATVTQANARFGTTQISPNSLLVTPGSLFLNVPYLAGTLRLTSDYAFANNANCTEGTIDVPAGVTFTYTGSVSGQARPIAALRGAGTNSIVTTITDFDFASGGSSALLTGTLRITGPYRSRVKGNVLSYATSMPAGSTIWVGNTMQLYSGGATYNANIVFEDGSALNSYYMDGNGIGNLRADGNLTLNGTLNLGNGQIRVGGNTASAIYTFNGSISGNFLQLDSSGYGNNCVFNLNANNTHTMTQLNDANENVTVNVNAAQGLGKNLSFVAGTGTSRVNIASNITATVDSVTSTDATTFINFNHASSSLTINSGSFMGLISGTGTLIKASAGTLSLGNSNTWSGVMTHNAGILELAHPQAITNAARLVCTTGAWVSGNPAAVGGFLTMPTNISGVASFKLYAMNRDGNTTNDRIRLKTGFVISATAMKFGLYNPDGSTYSVTNTSIVAQYEGSTAPNVATWASAVAGVTALFTTNTTDKTILMTWSPSQGVIDGTGYLWTKSSGDSWTSGANWSGTVAPPDSRNTLVRFGSSITNAATVNNATSTIGTLFASASAYLYTLSGTVDLTNLWLGAGSRLTATLSGTEITCASLQASAGIVTIPDASTLRVNVPTNQIQTFGGAVSNAALSATLRKEGPGQLKLTAVNLPGSIVVDEGTLELAKTFGSGSSSGPSKGTLTINKGARALATVTDALGYWAFRYTEVTINGGLFENDPLQTGNCGHDTIWHLTAGEMRSGSGINNVGNPSIFGMYGTVYSYATNVPSLIRGRLNFRGDNSRADMPFIVQDGSAAVDLDLQAAITISGGTAIRLKKQGAGTLRMSSVSQFTAPLWVTDGTLLMEESAIFSCSTFQIDAPGVIYHNTLGSNRIFGKALSGNGTFSIGATGSMTVTNAAAFAGSIRVDSGATLLASATYALPGIQLNGGVFNLGGVTQTALNLTNAAPSTINLTANGNGSAGKLTITGNNGEINLSSLTLNFADPTQINDQRAYTLMEVTGSSTLTGLPQSNLEKPKNLYISAGRKLVIAPVSTLIQFM